MKKQRKEKPYKFEAPVNGIMTCPRGHEWIVVDLNPERRTTQCPVGGENTSIRQGLKK